MKRIKLITMVCTFALTSCGGDNSSDPIAVVPAPTPTPAPTPSPTPTPTPTPAPTPAPTYDTAFDFSRDFSFFTQQSSVSSTSLTGAAPSFNASLNQPTTSAVSYRRADGQFASNLDLFADTFIETNTALERRYVIPATANRRASSFSFRVPSADYRYSAFGVYSLPLGRVLGTAQVVDTAEYRYQLIGVPTVVSDLPKTGSTTYPIRYSCSLLSGSTATSSAEILASMTINHATGAVTATLPNSAQSCFNNGPTFWPATLTFTGTIDNTTNQITGTISSVDSGFTGNFVGRLFGPAGVEAGLVFIVNRGGFALVAGQVLGRRG